ncbi:MAG: ArnT family glycosyltransferase [Sumerlaeia bacterium]
MEILTQPEAPLAIENQQSVPVIEPIIPLPVAVVVGWLCVLAAAVCGLIIPNWNLTYWDFGDGNYLYVGGRILDGLVPYKDILAPQPPLHQVMAAACQWFGEAIFGSALVGARAYTLILRLMCGLLIFFVGREWFRSDAHGLVAATIYLFLPIGFWWSIGVQSENIELVFLLFAFWGVLKLNKKWLLWAGVASALAMHCNMTALPYFLSNALFLGVRRPKLLGWYLLTTVPIWFLGAGITWAWAGPDYLDNVIFNQVGSFPRSDITGEPLLVYAWGKIFSQGKEVLSLEGQFIIIGLVALTFRWVESIKTLERNSDAFRRFEYAAWYCIGMLLSICFTAKGGTVNYIFVLGEPAVALLAADALTRLSTFAVLKFTQFTEKQSQLVSAIALALALFASALLTLGPSSTRKNLYHTTVGLQAELPYKEVIGMGNPVRILNTVVEVQAFIKAETEPGDLILASPFYAWSTDRVLAGEFAETYLWYIKYINERHDIRNGTITQPGPALLKVQELTQLIRERKIKLILLDDVLTGRIEPIRNAIQGNYVLHETVPRLDSRHNVIEVYVPIEGIYTADSER